MAKKGFLRADDHIGIRGLIEMPAIAIALGFDDADFFEILQAAQAKGGIGVEMGDAGQIAVGVFGWVFDVFIFTDAEFREHRVIRVAIEHAGHFRQVGAAAEMLADAAHDEDFDVVIDIGAVHQIRETLPRGDGGGVQCFRAVQGNGGDFGGLTSFSYRTISSAEGWPGAVICHFSLFQFWASPPKGGGGGGR